MLRSGNQDRARALLDRLRDLLAPPVPDEENAAILYAKALPLIDHSSPLGTEGRAYSAILRGEDPSPEGLVLLKEWLAKYSERFDRAIELLHEAADRSKCRFIPASEHVFGPDTDTILQASMACNLLSIKAYLAHLDGRPRDAGEDLGAAWALSQNSRVPPQIINQMIGIGLENIVIDSIQRDGAITYPEIASYVSSLDPAYGRAAWERPLYGEIYTDCSMTLAPNVDAAVVAELPNYIESMLEVLDLQISSYEEEQLLLEALAKKYGQDSGSGFAQEWIPTFRQVKRAMMASEVRRSVLQVALEVERYRSRRGSYPQTLDALGAPIPRDPLTGGVFEYRFEGDRILIQTSSAFRDQKSTSWKSKP